MPSWVSFALGGFSWFLPALVPVGTFASGGFAWSGTSPVDF